MEKKLDQRICLKFCVANGISCAESLKMLKNTFKDDCMSKTQAYDWYKAFKTGGREFVSDMPRSGRPSTSTTDENIETVKRIVLENRNIGIRKIAAKLNISYGSTKHILAEISGIKRVASTSTLVPRKLTSLQKEQRITAAKELIAYTENNPAFIRNIITGSDTWICEDDDKQTPKEEDEPKAKKSRQYNFLFTVFFDYNGIIHYEFLPDDQIANEQYYLDVASRLRESIRLRRSNLCQEDQCILHYNSSISLPKAVREFFLNNSIRVTDEAAAHLSDMSPCEFFLFPRLKLKIKDKSFNSTEAIKQNWIDELNAIPADDFKSCMEDWVKRWHICIALNGDCIEEECRK